MSDEGIAFHIESVYSDFVAFVLFLKIGCA